MNRWVYNGSMALGLILIATGAAIQFGLGYGLLAGGALLIALAMYGARVASRAG